MTHKKIIFSFTTLGVCCMTVLLLIYEPYASEAIRKSLSLFINNVLPPLFPYMVMSRLIVSLDLLAPVSRVTRVNRLFGMPECSSSVIFTGLLCGFPVGAAGTCTLYENGRISKKDASRLVALSSNTSPAFIIGTVTALWNSKKYGLFLYLVQIVSALAIAFAIHLLCQHSEGVIPERSVQEDKHSFTNELCRAVSDSATACLAVCAYIVFFRVAAVLCTKLIPSMAQVFSVVFEFSSGCVDGAAYGGITGIFMTGFAVGFAGLSVMMQNYNFIGRCGLPIRVLVVTKLLQGIVCATASALFYLLCPLAPVSTTSVFGEYFSWNAVLLVLSTLILMSKIYNISNRLI